jgi:haloacetate dehalogenase
MRSLSPLQGRGTQAQGQPIDSGHFLAEENPDATAKALSDFF